MDVGGSAPEWVHPTGAVVGMRLGVAIQAACAKMDATKDVSPDTTLQGFHRYMAQSRAAGVVIGRVPGHDGVDACNATYGPL